MQQPIWMCPVCKEGLARGARVFTCGSHSVDIAREGNVNLVLVQHRHSAAAGDPKDSVRHRRDFLEAGHYTPLAAALTDLLTREAPGDILDVGCGEGYYLRQLAAAPALAEVRLYGVDVAREAIRLAAKATPRIDYAVGNTHRLPVLPGSVGAVLQVFAPSASEEVRRVLRHGGLYIEVKPGAQHLEAFRALIYDEAHAHGKVSIPAGFQLERSDRVTFPLRLRQAGDVACLIEMTPYKWHMNPETYSRVCQLTALEDTADFAVSLYRPSDREAVIGGQLPPPVR